MTQAVGCWRVCRSVYRASTTVCVIQVGYNALLQGNPPEIVERNFRSILERIKAKEPAPRVLLTSIILSGDDTGTINARLAEVNSRLQRLAETEKTDWIDVNAILALRRSLSPGGQTIARTSMAMHTKLSPLC